jgi:hypothetical protein
MPVNPDSQIGRAHPHVFAAGDHDGGQLAPTSQFIGFRLGDRQDRRDLGQRQEPRGVIRTGCLRGVRQQQRTEIHLQVGHLSVQLREFLTREGSHPCGFLDQRVEAQHVRSIRSPRSYDPRPCDLGSDPVTRMMVSASGSDHDLLTGSRRGLLVLLASPGPGEEPHAGTASRTKQCPLRGRFPGAAGWIRGGRLRRLRRPVSPGCPG